jgi:hypothetical protein
MIVAERTSQADNAGIRAAPGESRTFTYNQKPSTDSLRQRKRGVHVYVRDPPNKEKEHETKEPW